MSGLLHLHAPSSTPAAPLVPQLPPQTVPAAPDVATAPDRQVLHGCFSCPWCYLASQHTDQLTDSRGSGTGAALLQRAADQARAQGRSLLRLDCGEDNDALRGYYAQQGLRPVGRCDTDGRWYSVVLLERPL